MTLVRLRQGLSEEDLAFRMKVSQSTVNRIVTTWISFLSRELPPLIHWPTRIKSSHNFSLIFFLNFQTSQNTFHFGSPPSSGKLDSSSQCHVSWESYFCLSEKTQRMTEEALSQKIMPDHELTANKNNATSKLASLRRCLLPLVWF